MSATRVQTGWLRSGALWCAIGVLGVAGLGFGAAVSRYRLMLDKEPIYPADGRTLIKLPRETERWVMVGADRRESPEVEKTLGTSNYISRIYVRKDTKDDKKPIHLDLHVAYYTGMIDTVPHVPDRCFVGGGMQLGEVVGNLPLNLDDSSWRPVLDLPESLADQSVYEARLSNRYSDRPGSYVTLPLRPRDIQMRTMGFSQRGQSLYSGYFFIANGGWVARADDVRLLAFNLRNKYAYYCKVQVTSAGVESGQELVEHARDLLSDMLPEIMLCLPDWVQVEKGLYPPADPAQGSGGSPPGGA